MINKLYVNGKWVDSSDKSTFPVFNPANMQEIAQVARAGTRDAQIAIESAEAALKSWSLLTGKERSEYIRKFFNLLERDRSELAKIIVLENGKVLKEALAEIDYGSSIVEWFAEEAKRIYGEIVPSVKSQQKLLTIKQPVGVVAAITPWNFPIAMILKKLAPALAAGCTVIIKPSEETPLSALKLVSLCHEAGIPKGVVNVICGNAEEIGEALTSSKIVRMLTFTGSTKVGKLLYAKCANTVKKVTLELGGNAPFIVYEDADIEKAVDALIAVKVRNAGQSCIAANRVFINESILKEFNEKLINKFSKLKTGDGFDETNQLGPLINKAAVNKINLLLNDAYKHGSKELYRCDLKVELDGCFINPTIIMNLKKNLLIEHTEIFGPIISMFSFKEDEEVVARANNTDYGLAAYFFTNDQQRIWRVSEALEYGMVGINDVAISNEMTCFGGIKESGLGRECGKQGISEYLEDKFIAIS